MSTNVAVTETVALDRRDLYENAPCGYHSVRSDRTILRMNQTELAWLGFMQQELVGKRKFTELVPPRFYNEYKRAFEALIVGREVSEIDIELVRKDGSMFDAFLRIAAMRDGEGDVSTHTRHRTRYCGTQTR